MNTEPIETTEKERDEILARFFDVLIEMDFELKRKQEKGVDENQ